MTKYKIETRKVLEVDSADLGTEINKVVAAGEEIIRVKQIEETEAVN